MSAGGAGLRVAVLSCGALGVEMAAALAGAPGVASVTLVTSPLRPKPQTLLAKARRLYRYEGPLGVARLALRRLARGGGAPKSTLPGLAAAHAGRFAHVRVRDLNGEDGRAALAALAPDLGVVVASYILRRETFAIPRLGSINLHMGLAPRYRGSSPGFWELWHGEREAGVTIHRVTEALDGGDILAQARVPLDPAPTDHRRYLYRFQRETLVPAGIALVRSLVPALAAGTVAGTPQDPALARTFRRATWAEHRALARRLAERRRAR